VGSVTAANMQHGTGLGVPGNGTPALMLGAIGVVYGDSGTSPL
jgi:K+ transporter